MVVQNVFWLSFPGDFSLKFITSRSVFLKYEIALISYSQETVMAQEADQLTLISFN